MKLVIPPRPEDYHNMIAYSFTKALNVLTAMQQQRIWGTTSAVAVAAHPGVIPTDILSVNVGVNAVLFDPVMTGFIHKDIHQGVATTTYCLVAPAVPDSARKAM